MVRNYKRKVGARQYKNYTDDQLKSVVKQIAKGELKFRDAVQQYKISTGTLVKYARCYKQALREAHQNETQENVSNNDRPTLTSSIRSLMKYQYELTKINRAIPIAFQKKLNR